MRRHSSGSSTSLLRCVLIVREPTDLLFFSHGRTLTASRACSKPPENSTPAWHPQRLTVIFLKAGDLSCRYHPVASFTVSRSVGQQTSSSEPRMSRVTAAYLGPQAMRRGAGTF